MVLGQLLQRYQPYLPFIMLSLLGLGLILILILVLTAKRLKRQSSERMALARPARLHQPLHERLQPWRQALDSITSTIKQFIQRHRPALDDENSLSIKKAVAFMRNYWGYHAEYRLPWFLMVGADDADKLTVLQSPDLQPALARADYQHIHSDLDWWFYDRAVVINIKDTTSTVFNDSEANVTLWTKLMHGLVHYRAKKPLDGIIVALSATALYGDDRLSDTAIKDRAQSLRSQLQLAQRKLGMRLPVYVIITGCEIVTGFQGLVAETPTQNQSDIFGWSSPFSLDTSFAPTWMHDIFKTLLRSLHKVRMAICTEGSVWSERDNNIVFPQEFMGLQEPLGQYLQTLFQDTAYQESFFLRGVYFTGVGAQDTPSLSTTGAGAHTPVFIKDLFLKKIFAETGLAQPITHVLLSRNRRFTIIKSAAAGLLVCWLLAAAYQRNSLIQNNKVLVDTLTTIDNALHGLQDKNWLSSQETNDPLMMNYLEQQTTAVLDRFTHIKSVNSFALTLPSSWFSSLDQRVAAAFKKAYASIILPALETALIKRGQDMTSLAVPSAATSRGDQGLDNSNPIQLPTFIALQSYVDAVTTYEDAVNRYNNLEKKHDVRDLGWLIQYLFNRDLSTEFYINTAYYDHALGLMVRNPIVLKDLKMPANRKLGMLFKSFLDDVLVTRQHYVLFTNLEKKLEALTHVNVNSQFDDTQLRTLVQEAMAVADVLSSGQWSWINKAAFEPDPSYSTMMNQIVTSELLGKVIGEEIATISNREFAKFKLSLTDFKSSFTGPFFAIRQNQVIAEPAETFINFIDAASGLLAEPFMVKNSYRMFDQHIHVGKILFWEDEILRKAVTIIEAFDEFGQQRLPQVTDKLRALFKTIAQNSLRKKVTTLIAQAQSYQTPIVLTRGLMTPEVLQAQVHNLATVTPAFAKILGAMEAKSYMKEAVVLKRLLIKQTHDALTAVDKMLEAENLYRGREDELDQWNGDPLVGLRAFGVYDKAEMKNYLNAQRYRIQFLAKDLAEPVLSLLSLGFIESTPQSLPLVYKWSRIAAVLADYDNMSPTNSLKILEKFLVNDINDMTLEACQVSDNNVVLTDSTGDYFLELRHSYLQKLLKRCQGVITERAFEQYNQAASFFNQNLAGRFPFIQDRGNAAAVDADPAVVQDFYTMLRNLDSSGLITLLKQQRRGPLALSVQNFLSTIERTQSFIQAVIPVDDKVTRTLQMIVAFRSQRQQEKGGDKLIDWTLSAGTTKVGLRDQQLILNWQAALPIQVQLRWAADASTLPMEDQHQPDMNIDNNQALFTYGGPWALLRLLRGHRATNTTNTKPGQNSSTLGFTIPTTYNPACYHDNVAVPKNLVNEPTQVFCTIDLQVIEQRANTTQDAGQVAMKTTTKSITAPIFPHEAPVIEASSTAKSRR